LFETEMYGDSADDSRCAARIPAAALLANGSLKPLLPRGKTGRRETGIVFQATGREDIGVIAPGRIARSDSEALGVKVIKTPDFSSQMHLPIKAGVSS